MKIPKPDELGLQIDRWRPQQEQGLIASLQFQTRALALCSPTGSGKSHMALGAAMLSKKPTVIITESRGLQDQYIKLAKGIGVADIRGRRNYQCNMREDYTCEEGKAGQCPYVGSPACPRSAAENAVASATIVLTNYDLWTSSKGIIAPFLSHIQQVIFDESHNCFDALSRALQLEIGTHEIEKDLKIELPDEDRETLETWSLWARYAKVTAEALMITAHARITGVTKPRPTDVRMYTHMRNLVRKLAILSVANSREWVVEESKHGYVFDVIRPARYAESGLLLRIPRMIFLSASLRPKAMYMIGLGKDKFEFLEFPSDFDPARCPIYYIPVMQVDSSNPDRSRLWVLLDQIASRRRHLKGLVLTTSFEYQREVELYSRWKQSMLLNKQGESTTSMITEFKESEPGRIMVTPSVGEGYDFPDDDCRWEFVVKVPFDPPSKILAAREELDREYRGYRAIQKLVQNWGRIIRSKKDWGERFIADRHLEWVWRQYHHLAPNGFNRYIKQVQVAPSPLQIEGR